MKFFRWKQRKDEELDDEIQQHLEMAARERIERGESAEQARLNVRREFGNVALVKEATRAMWGWTALERLLQDLEFGVRMLRKNAGYASVAIFTLALGIGATAAIFSVVNAVLIRPLAFHEPERLVWLTNTNPSLGVTQAFLNPEDILDFREQAQSLEQVASWGTFPQNIVGGRSAERVENIYVTSNFFRMLGVTPMLGRDFLLNEDDDEGDDNPIIISYGLWQRQFGGAADVIGRKLVRNGNRQEPSIIVGVLPPGLNFPQRVDMFETYDYKRGWGRGGSHNDRTIARLKPGYTFAQAQAELSNIARWQARQFPATHRDWDYVITPFQDHLFGYARVALPLLLGAVGLLLLLACTNVAGLQLARAVTRQKELAIRLALGAGRERIIRQLLTESLLLVLAGGASGLLLAQWLLALVRALGPDTLPRLKEAALDSSTFGFAAAVTILSAVFAGLLPAWRMSRFDLNATLAGASNTSTVAPPAQRFRRVLVVTQLALAMSLLVGAGLLMRSFWRLQQTSPGFAAERVLSAGLSLNLAEFREAPQRRQVFRRALERLSALPGVEAAAGISLLPFGGRTMQLECRLAEQPQRKGLVDYRVVTPGLFDLLRVPLRRGRALTERDTENTAQVCVVNEAFARAYLPNTDPLGQRLQIGYEGEQRGEIVGVVGDIRHRGLEADAVPTVYVCDLQGKPFSDFPIFNFVVRTRGEAAALSESVRQTVQAAAPNQVVFNVRTLDEFVADTLAQRRFSMLLLAAFAALALLLAATGLCGVMSYLVTQQTREFGIRQALGATRRDVLRLVLRQGLRLAALGMVLGLVISVAASRLLAAALYGISPTDPLTLAAITFLLLAIALLACWIPARRATKVNPLVALRHE